MNFEQVECSIENAFKLGDLVLRELVKIIVASFIKNAQINITTNYVGMNATTSLAR